MKVFCFFKETITEEVRKIDTENNITDQVMIYIFLSVIFDVLVIKTLKTKLQGLGLSAGHFNKSLGQELKLSFTKP
jgi:hypothetical protein